MYISGKYLVELNSYPIHHQELSYRLEEHQKGKIIVDGNELTEDTKNIEKIRAEVGMVFQQFNLFPHLSIVDNCALAPIWVK